MPAEEKGVHQVFRESGGRAGKSEQSAYRGTQETEGALLWKRSEIGKIRFDFDEWLRQSSRKPRNSNLCFFCQVRHIISGHD